MKNLVRWQAGESIDVTMAAAALDGGWLSLPLAVCALPSGKALTGLLKGADPRVVEHLRWRHCLRVVQVRARGGEEQENKVPVHTSVLPHNVSVRPAMSARRCDGAR